MRSILRFPALRRGVLAGMVTAAVAMALSLAGSSRPGELDAAEAKSAILPTYLEKIPQDCDLFAHVRVADLYRNSVIADIRKNLGKVATDLEKKAEEGLGMPPENIETATFCFPHMPMGPGDQQLFYLIVSTVKPYEQAKVLKEARHGESKGKVVPLQDDMVLHLTGDRLFAIMHKSMVDDYVKVGAQGKSGPLADAIKLAAGGKHPAVAGVNFDSLPAEIRSALPLEAQPFKPLLEAHAVTFWGDIGKEVKAELRFQCKNADSAQDAERSWKLLMSLANEGLNFLMTDNRTKKDVEDLVPAFKGLQDTIKNETVKVNGDALVVGATYQGELPVAVIMQKMFGKARGAAARSQTTNNLKQIALAMHNYHDAFNGFPPGAICDKRGKPLLSWRVALLPYLEQNDLYMQFKLDEPWDSEHNKKLLAKMPAVYRFVETYKEGDTKTHFRVFEGNGAAWDMLQQIRLQDITDGTSNTAMIVAAAEPIEWTRPVELEYDRKKDPRKVVLWIDHVSPVAVFDGSVRYVSDKMSEATWHNFIEKADGNPLGSDF